MATQVDLAQLPAMKTNPKFIFFTDFDGTITLHDSNDWMTDNLGYGEAQRLSNNKEVLAGKLDFRDVFQGMMDSIHEPLDKCISLLVANVKLDPYFARFLDFALERGIPVVVLSGGMLPIIRALLDNLLGPEKAGTLQLVANDVKPQPGKTLNERDGWDIAYHDDSGHGHDKSLTLRPYAALPAGVRPTMFYAGDGVSDLSAARETDLLFAKEGKDLVTFCVKEGIPFTLFRDWESIFEGVRKIVDGQITVQDAAREGFAAYQKENPQTTLPLSRD